MKLNYPKVNTDSNQKVFISFFIEKKRYRLYNGSRIGSDINPNSFPLEQRKSIGNLLAAEVYNYLINGGVLESYRNNEIISGKLSDKDYLTRALETKLKGPYSSKYKMMLQGVHNAITVIISGSNTLQLYFAIKIKLRYKIPNNRVCVNIHIPQYSWPTVTSVYNFIMFDFNIIISIEILK